MSDHTVDPAAVLAQPMGPNDAGADTVGHYLVALLARLWEYGDGFSGKRPFGESGWHHHLYRALVTGGLVAGDDDGYPVDEAVAFDLVTAAIQALATPTTATAPAAAVVADAPAAVDLRTLTHPLHDFTADGWRYWCEVCNPIPDLDRPDAVQSDAQDRAA